jgi:hypothetical protein
MMQYQPSLSTRNAEAARNEKSRLAFAINFVGLFATLAVGTMVMVAMEAGGESLSAIEAQVALDMLQSP